LNMQIIEAIVVDDEEKSRKVLRKLLASFCREIKVIAEAESVDQAFTLINSLKPQLVFLDIQMPTGTGLSLLEKFGTIPFDVIFVTGFDQYAINAIKFSALDYLLKPIDVKELKSAVERALNKARHKEDRQVQIVNLLNNIDPGSKEKKISVHKNEKVLFINLGDIIYIEADDRYCTITTRQREGYTLAKTLKEFEEFFSNTPSLIRISRSLMINVDFIESYTKEEPCLITLQDGKVFEIPRRKKQDILELLKRRS
jgi:two-component system LytT family response regulator